MIAWAIGNGQSRLSFDLTSITDYTVGCNALYRDFYSSELVAVDRRMVAEILTSSYANPVYTRPDWCNEFRDSRVRSLPNIPFTGPQKADIPFHWNSGPYAILLACLQYPKEINLVGFDLWSDQQLVNNVYKGTSNYDPVSHRAIDPSHWIYQFKKITTHFNSIHFIQHQTINWAIPDEWTSIKNLTIKYFPV